MSVLVCNDFRALLVEVGVRDRLLDGHVLMIILNGCRASRDLACASGGDNNSGGREVVIGWRLVEAELAVVVLEDAHDRKRGRRAGTAVTQDAGIGDVLHLQVVQINWCRWRGRI